jgi:septum formation protein
VANPALVLASASPRRVELLRQLRLPFEQVVSPAPEPEPGEGSPEDFVALSAATKARAVAALVAERGATVAPAAHRRGAALVVGADTVVVCEGRILGKPADAEEARQTLCGLAGRSHSVCTGLAVVDLTTGTGLSASETSQVYMTSISKAAIAAYVDTGEPLDKAGSYAIQGLGGRFIERVDGCYYNVVGLPLARLCALLQSAGYDLESIQDPG